MIGTGVMEGTVHYVMMGGRYMTLHSVVQSNGLLANDQIPKSIEL